MKTDEHWHPRSLLGGALNFRDLGGLASWRGLQTKAGMLFRSDTLQAATAEDLARLVNVYGIKVVVDLRLAREAAEEGRGTLLDETSVCYINSPLGMAQPEGPPSEILTSLYLRCLEPESTLPRAVEVVATMAGRPTVIHCAAGKDRTGLVVALVLRLLGVPDDVIVEDYMASGPNMAPMLVRFAEWPRYRDHIASLPAQVYDVDEQALRAFLTEVDRRFGSTRDWARHHGIRRETLDHLLEALLAPT